MNKIYRTFIHVNAHAKFQHQIPWTVYCYITKLYWNYLARPRSACQTTVVRFKAE